MNVNEQVIGQRRIPDETRKRILESAFQEFYRKGYQAASINAGLADTGLTKGALYHHFRNKKELAMAVIDEGIAPFIRSHWEDQDPDKSPIENLQIAFTGVFTRVSETELTLGCPLNNLVQEMAPIDEDFRERLKQITFEWRDAIAERFREGQARGQVRTDIDLEGVATFLVSSFEGILGTTKASRDPSWPLTAMKVLYDYIETLAAPQDVSQEMQKNSP